VPQSHAGNGLKNPEPLSFEPADDEIAAQGDKGLALELADMHAECAQILNAAGQRTGAGLQAERARALPALSAVQ